MKKNFRNKLKWSDHYTKKAKIDRYPARSVYKLQEIQKKYCILKKQYSVLDLGCFPGSWLLYASKIIGINGRVVGIDIKPVKINVPGNVDFVCENVFDFFLKDRITSKFNTIMSDMAPNTTGSNIVDSTSSYNLCKVAFEIANKRLVKKGNFVCKIFQSEKILKMIKLVRNQFEKQILFKPKSCRKRSKEIYLIGLNKI